MEGLKSLLIYFSILIAVFMILIICSSDFCMSFILIILILCPLFLGIYKRIYTQIKKDKIKGEYLDLIDTISMIDALLLIFFIILNNLA